MGCSRWAPVGATRSGRTGGTSVVADDEHVRARVALHLGGDVVPDELREEAVMMRADNDERRLAVPGDIDEHVGGITRRPEEVGGDAFGGNPLAGVREHGLELIRHHERDHPCRAVVQRAEILGSFRVERELDHRDDDETCPTRLRLIERTVERALRGVLVVIADHDRAGLGRCHERPPPGGDQPSLRCGDGPRSVRGVVVGKELPLAFPPREREEDENRAREDGDDPGRVGPLVSLEERRLRGGGDLARVLGVLGCEVGRAREGELELALRAVDHLLPVRGGRDRRAHGRGVPGGEQRAEDRGQERSSEVALQVGRARGHSGPLHRHRAGERVRGRRPGEAYTDADEGIGDADFPVGAALPPEEQHRQESQQQEDVADQQRETGAFRLDELRGPRRHEDHEDDRRQDRCAGLYGRVAENVLQVLLAHERRRHQRAEDDDPGARGDPEDPARSDVEVVERILRTPLPEHESDPCRERDREQPDREGALVGDRREVDPQDQSPDHDQRKDSAEVVDGLRGLVDVAGDEEDGHHQGKADERQGHEEDRAPPEVLEESSGDQRPERRDAAADRRPERNGAGPPRPRPECRDQRERSRVGHAGREPADEARDEENLVGRRVRGQQARGDGEEHSEHEQELAPVAVADRPQPENGRREPERIADRDQVERRLGRVEGRADRRQGDVGHREIEVGDRRDEDQRDENEPSPFGRHRRLGSVRLVVHCSSISLLPRPGLRRPVATVLT